eukprot:5416851-Ditylum_brightwellii.AAC.1
MDTELHKFAQALVHRIKALHSKFPMPTCWNLEFQDIQKFICVERLCQVSVVDWNILEVPIQFLYTDYPFLYGEVLAVTKISPHVAVLDLSRLLRKDMLSHVIKTLVEVGDCLISLCDLRLLEY